MRPVKEKPQRNSAGRVFVLKLTVLLLVAVLLGGCLFLRQPSALFGGLLTLRVANVAQLNKDMPVAVEVLVVYDQKILAQAEKLTATQWFEGREQFFRDNPPGSSTFESWKWEWVPGQSVPDQELRYSLGARATLVFVSYSAPGPHRAKIAPRQDFLLELQANDFRVTRLH